MCRDINAQVILFFRFMRLFDITEFRLLESDSSGIDAVIGWGGRQQAQGDDDDDTQGVRWTCVPPDSLADALSLAEYAQAMGMIDSDRISIAPDTAGAALGWDARRTEGAYRQLLEIRVAMVDDGKEADIFFLHP